MFVTSSACTMHDFPRNFSFGNAAPEARLGSGLLISALLHLAIISSLGPVVIERSAPAEQSEHEFTVTLVSGSAASASSKRIHPAKESARPNPIALPLPVAPHYFESTEVDVPARIVNDVMLHYPPSAYKQRISGEVKLKLFINQTGEVDEVAVVTSDPIEIFDQAAVDAAKQLRYSPAFKDGAQVRTTKTIVITFDPTTNPL